MGLFRRLGGEEIVAARRCPISRQDSVVESQVLIHRALDIFLQEKARGLLAVRCRAYACFEHSAAGITLRERFARVSTRFTRCAREWRKAAVEPGGGPCKARTRGAQVPAGVSAQRYFELNHT